MRGAKLTISGQSGVARHNAAGMGAQYTLPRSWTKVLTCRLNSRDSSSIVLGETHGQDSTDHQITSFLGYVLSITNHLQTCFDSAEYSLSREYAIGAFFRLHTNWRDDHWIS
jgi:hypothetical protein